MLKPGVLALGQELLGCKPGFGSLVVNYVPAGSEGMGAHVDSPYAQMTDEELAENRPCLCLQMIWYLEDVTEDSAPTAVVPGSQMRGRRPHPRDFWDEAVSVLVKAGTLFVSHGALWHATEPNRTDRIRPVVISKYFPSWSRPPWNPFCQLPPELLPGMVDLMYPDYRLRAARGWSG
jgi:ectoine hydroxylase-related dioxygenase (phytanoyl-CoA dioxygenase family)